MDLTWRAVQYDGGDVYMKWRYFIDYRSKLPVRIEKYSKGDPNGVYTLEEVLVMEYPSDKQVTQAEQEISGLRSK